MDHHKSLPCVLRGSPTPKLSSACRRWWLGLYLIALMVTFASVVNAQDPDKPLALIRQVNGSESYFIRVQTNAVLPERHKVSAILSNKSALLKWDENVQPCTEIQIGRFCRQVIGGLLEMTYGLSARPQASDKLKVSFSLTNESGVGSFRSIDLISDLKTGGPRIDGVCGNGLLVDYQADNQSLGSNQAEQDYYRSRLIALNVWLRRQKANPADMAVISIESLSTPGLPDPVIRSFTVGPALHSKTPEELDVESALAAQRVVLCLRFDQKLPAEKFNARVAFRNQPPMELEKPLVKALSGPKGLSTPIPSKVPEDNKLGLRSFDNNLEIGTLFTSSVKDVKSGNTTTRQRQSRGALDLRFAPLLRDRTRRPEAGKWQLFRTPLLIDAKVSSGKISEESLSLNRILFGTEFNFRYVQGTQKGKRNKYLITIRGTNASDRDFKLAEAKGEFEFRPIFETLNQPLKTQRTSTKSILIPDGPPKEVASGGIFGYQIQPFVGFELGRVYRRSRSAFKTEEQSDNVRRLLFGIDMAINVTPRLLITLNDIFFVRGESEHRNRNYFNGTLEAPLGNLSRNATQSIFFSFERGNQPPFATPAVNAMKFGYRVRSDFFSVGSAR